MIIILCSRPAEANSYIQPCTRSAETPDATNETCPQLLIMQPLTPIKHWRSSARTGASQTSGIDDADTELKGCNQAIQLDPLTFLYSIIATQSVFDVTTSMELP
jgi:hypothetical protein